MHYNLEIQCFKDCKPELNILIYILPLLVTFSMSAGKLDNFDINEPF
jgi:hypothetical protein